ncbi:Alpha-galactosidase [Hondaea fermentalgiana]|uniref:Alpha-galactosidase n=1 Tax=Hondaea fermentalgiana TaxID=2315210 RepID=A0A2R5GEM7_9STRA|nr:Alpha-galactosidase [Hondaea fermentalgiana]|eukprot:GBG29025.1 Alpha-galactosidase [Hondaea fermentalgiana]
MSHDEDEIEDEVEEINEAQDDEYKALREKFESSIDVDLIFDFIVALLLLFFIFLNVDAKSSASGLSWGRGGIDDAGLRRLAGTTFDVERNMVILPGRECTTNDKVSGSDEDSLQDCVEKMVSNPWSKSFTWNPDTKRCVLYELCETDKASSDSNNFIYRRYNAPLRGWSAWNAFYFWPTQDRLLEEVRQMKKTGLVDRGFNIFHVDGVCSYDNIDPTGSYVVRTNMKNGEYTAESNLTDPINCLPMGMQAWSDMLHENGFLVSWYTTGNMKTCAHPTKIRQDNVYEQLVENDMQKYSEWNIDVLKIDNCGGKAKGYNEKKVMQLWAGLRDKYMPNLLIENCRYGCRNLNESWCNQVAEYTRSGGDSRPWAGSVWEQASKTSQANVRSGPTRGWGYGDALQICNYDFKNWNPHPEERIKGQWHKGLDYQQIGAWFILSSPMFVSTQVGNCTKDVIDLLLDEDLNNIHQYWSGDSGRIIQTQKDKNKHIIRTLRKVIDVNGERWENFLVADVTDDLVKNVQAFDTQSLIDKHCTSGFHRTKTYWNIGAGDKFRSTMFSCITEGITNTPTTGPTRSPTNAVTGRPTKEPTTPKPTKEPTAPQPTKGTNGALTDQSSHQVPDDASGRLPYTESDA